MTIEIPVLRLGLAGYTEAQQKQATDAAAAAGTARANWELGSFAEADAWWLEGQRTMLMPNQHLRVQPAVPRGRSVQIALSDVDRPVAFSLPITAPGFDPAVTFDLADSAAAIAVLHQFAGWMQTMLSQFALASSIVDNQPSLISGSWEVLRDTKLLAVVDLKLGAGVMPGVSAREFRGASWCVREHGAVSIPHNYPRASVSQVMWQYAQRTQRDLLPPHYRSHPLYFRRPPRLAHQQLKDAHLLVMRELMAHPGMTFLGVQQATGLAEAPLARVLSALYVVGSITSNKRRALPSGDSRPAADSAAHESSLSFPVLDSTPRLSKLPTADMTAPLTLTPDR